VAQPAEALGGVDAAVVELDPLADPIRPGADDHHPWRLRCRRRLVRLPERRVVVVRLRSDLARTRVDAPIDALPGRRPLVPQALELRPEPGMEALGEVVQPIPWRDRAGVELPRAERLPERLAEGPADAHRLADGLHLSPERPVGAGELLEREAWELYDHVVERGLEARR